MGEQLVFLFFIASLVLFFLAVLYLLLTNTSKHENDSYEKALSILDQAQKDAQRIVKDANIKAWQTLENANNFNKNISRSLEESIKHLSHKQLAELEQTSKSLYDTYQQVVQEQSKASEDAVSSATQEMKEKVLAEVEEFGEALQKETIESQEAVEQKIKQEYDRLLSELDVYRQAQYAKLDNEIYEITSNAVKKVLGRAVPLDAQERIVMECLEEAKKEGFFKS